MAFQAVPNTAEFRVEVSYGTGGVPLQNIIHVRNTVVPWTTGSHLQDTADNIAAWYDAEIATIIHDGITAGNIQARDLTTEFGIQASSAIIAGTLTGDRLPPQVFALVQVAMDFGGAPRSGSWQHFGVREADQNNGQLDATPRAAIDAAWTQLPVDVGSGFGGDAVVKVSRFSGFTLVDFPDGTKRKVPTPRSPALTNTIRDIGVDVFLRTNKGRHFPAQ